MNEQTTTTRIFEVNEAAWTWWRHQANSPGEWTRSYLTGRGLRGVQAGCAPEGWARLVGTLRRRGFVDDELVAAGVAHRTSRGQVIDAFRDRLVLAIRDQHANILGFTARRAPDAGDDVAKYINTTSTAVYDKTHVLYGLDAPAVRALAAGARPVLVEGALDVEAARRVGGNLVPIAACGTAITPEQLDLLRSIEPGAVGRLVVALDSDHAGQRAAARVWAMMPPAEQATAQAARLHPGADPADYLRCGRRQDLTIALTGTHDLTQVVVDQHLAAADLEHIEGRVAAVRAIATELAHLPAAHLATTAAFLTARMSERLDPQTVTDEIIAAHLAQAGEAG